jgi:hypothetical protein
VVVAVAVAVVNTVPLNGSIPLPKDSAASLSSSKKGIFTLWHVHSKAVRLTCSSLLALGHMFAGSEALRFAVALLKASLWR